jgi:uncharacterized protein YeaC (DUF1315 family)
MLSVSLPLSRADRSYSSLQQQQQQKDECLQTLMLADVGSSTAAAARHLSRFAEPKAVKAIN